MTFAIIAARGGSRRLPRKNVRLLCGHPLIAWAIIQAKASKHITDVYVTTDDDEIEVISKQYGAKVIRRPDWPDANEASAIRPIAHAIEYLQKIHGNEFDEMVAMLPTNPLNQPSDIDRGIELFREYACDSMIPLRTMRETALYKKQSILKAKQTIFSKHYEYLGESGSWVITTPRNYLALSKNLESDLDSAIDQNNEKEGQGASTYYLPMEYWQYADVDTKEEFEFAEVLMNHYICKGAEMEPYYAYMRNHKATAKIKESLGARDTLEGTGGGN